MPTHRAGGGKTRRRPDERDERERCTKSSAAAAAAAERCTLGGTSLCKLETKVHMYARARAHAVEERGVCKQTLMGSDLLQQARYDEMDTADQLQQKLHNAARRPLPVSPSVFPFSNMTSFNPAPPPLTPPLSSILLPPLFISALCSCRLLFIFLIFIALRLPRSPPRPAAPLLWFPDLKRTPRQTAEYSDSPGSDLGSEL